MTTFTLAGISHDRYAKIDEYANEDGLYMLIMHDGIECPLANELEVNMTPSLNDCDIFFLGLESHDDNHVSWVTTTQQDKMRGYGINIVKDTTEYADMPQWIACTVKPIS